LSEDLYYRVSILTIGVPPLRERSTDIELLVDHILKRVSRKQAAGVTGVSRDAYDALLHYSWPGNILQLEQAIEQAVILGKGRGIQVTDLPEAILVVRTPEPRNPEPAVGPKRLTLEEPERQAILEALESTNWNKIAAAGLLGLHRPTLYSKMREHGIPLNRLPSKK
jgi:DNA-binding NtrC family response regulator